MRTLFTNYSKLRFAHKNSVQMEHVRRKHVCAMHNMYDTCIHLLFSWPCSSSLPEDLPKPFGAYTLPTLRQTLQTRLFSPPEACTSACTWCPHGADAPGNHPSQPQDAQAPFPRPKHRSCSELVCPSMCLEHCPLCSRFPDAHPSRAPLERKGPCLPGSPPRHLPAADCR